MKKSNNKGFSLVELIIVIAIMAVLVGVLAPQFIKYVESSRQSTDLQNIEQLKTAAEVEIAANDKVSTAQIVITTSGVSVELKDKDGADIPLSSGVSSATFKSTGWAAYTYVYDVANYKWGKAAGVSADPVNNTKNPHRNYKDVFQ